MGTFLTKYCYEEYEFTFVDWDDDHYYYNKYYGKKENTYYNKINYRHYDKQPKLPEIIIDFDKSSDAWKKNKIKSRNGTYLYK